MFLRISLQVYFDNLLFLIFLAITSSQAQQNVTSTAPPINSNARFNDELVSHVVAAGGVTTLTSTGSMGISGTPGMSPPLSLIEPKFSYVNFNTANSTQIMSMIVINSQVNLLANKLILIYITVFFFNCL